MTDIDPFAHPKTVPTDHEILTAVTLGYSYRAIAERLNIAPGTVAAVVARTGHHPDSDGTEWNWVTSRDGAIRPRFFTAGDIAARNRRIIELRERYGMPYRTIAEEVGCSPGTAHRVVRRATTGNTVSDVADRPHLKPSAEDAEPTDTIDDTTIDDADTGDTFDVDAVTPEYYKAATRADRRCIIVAMRAAGLSGAEIGKRIGRTQQAVSHTLKTWGDELKDCAPPPTPTKSS